MNKRSTIDGIMTEHIRLPGAPMLIVTRGFANRWLKKLNIGLPLLSRDRMTFLPEATDEPLSDLEMHADFLASVENRIREDFAE
jgi:hypothetical protein